MKKQTYRIVPEPISGYVLDPKHGYFSIILPEERTNYILNPSVEIDSFGYTLYSGAAIARSTTYARRGVYSLRITPNANQDSGVFYNYGGLVVAAGIYAIGVDIWASPGIPIVVTAFVGVGAESVVARTKGKGRWERVTGLFRTAGDTGITIRIRKEGSFSIQPFYIDGLQFESGNYPTTYVDGDQVGYKPGVLDYYWIGAPHAGHSIRTKFCRSGGKVVPLKDYGFDILSIIGLGMSGVETDIMQYGTLDGGEYHDSHTPSREFSLLGTIFGKYPGELQRKRRQLIDAFKPDLVMPKQSPVLRYEFGDHCEQEGLILELPAVYTDGFGGQFDNHHQERLAISFIAPWPYLLEEGSDNKLLDDLDSVAAETVTYRQTNGQWANAGNATSGGGAGAVYDMIQSPSYGGIFLAGDFDVFGGANSDNFVFVNLSSHVITNYTPWADDVIRVLYETPNGTIYMGGAFHNIGVNARAHLAYMDSAGTDYDLAGGADNVVYAIAVGYNGDVYVGGDFANVGTGGGAVAAAYIAMYDVSATAWTNITPLGAADGRINKILIGSDGMVYVCGGFAAINGITCNHVAMYNPTTGVWSALGGGLTGGNALDLCFGADGRLYACGTFTAPGAYMAVYNGANWEQLGAGISATIIGTTVINKMHLGPDNKLYFAGDFAIPSPIVGAHQTEYATWDGSSFGYLDGQPPAQADFQACDGLDILVTNGGEVWCSFEYSTATPGARFYCGQVNTLVNDGSAIAHPCITCRISGGIYWTLYIRNVTTGDELRFDLAMEDGGRFFIDTTPGMLRSWSNTYNIEHTLFDGSDLATFKLLPGSNTLSVFSERSGTPTPTAITGLYWRNNFWGVDDGVV